jgi:uracil-DNA glycosylase family 4
MKEIKSKCKRCKSDYCSQGLKGINVYSRKLLFTAHMIDERIFQEDLLGQIGHHRAFLMSASGKALANILSHEQLRLTLEDIYFTNIFKGFFKNRKPKARDYRACLAEFEKQVKQFAPRLIVLMGSYAFNSVFPEENFDDNLGRQFLYQDTPTLVTYHPSTILKMPMYHRLRLVDVIKSSLN